MEQQHQQVPAWKFWHPLTVWHTLLIALLCELVISVPIAMLNGGLRLGIPMWIPNGVAGAATWFVVRYFARKKLAASS